MRAGQSFCGADSAAAVGLLCGGLPAVWQAMAAAHALLVQAVGLAAEAPLPLFPSTGEGGAGGSPIVGVGSLVAHHHSSPLAMRGPSYSSSSSSALTQLDPQVCLERLLPSPPAPDN